MPALDDDPASVERRFNGDAVFESARSSEVIERKLAVVELALDKLAAAE